ncbi:MAG: ABC transporter permease, partial [Acidimicrobiales bacterium]
SIGILPAYLALVALAIPPVLTNSYTGVRAVDKQVVEAARAMGMTGRQVLVRVELPNAVGLIMAGLRTTAVEVVATATLAAYVAFGGLGRYIIDGLATQDQVQLFCGAVMVAILAGVVDVAFALVQRALTPAGLKRPAPRRGRAWIDQTPAVEPG